MFDILKMFDTFDILKKITYITILAKFKFYL